MARGGYWPKPDPRPVHPAQPYNGSTAVSTDAGTISGDIGPTGPAVRFPWGHDGHGTQVDTPSMVLFATNIESLIEHVDYAREVLAKINVQPGAFYDADKIRVSINGVNHDAGLKAQFIQALRDLSQGLGDLRDGVAHLSKKYQTLEEANTMTAKDLQDAISAPQSYFGALVTDTGSSGPGTS